MGQEGEEQVVNVQWKRELCDRNLNSDIIVKLSIVSSL